MLLWSLVSGEIRQVWQCDRHGVGLAFDPSSETLLVGESQAVSVWFVPDGKRQAGF